VLNPVHCHAMLCSMQDHGTVFYQLLMKMLYKTALSSSSIDTLPEEAKDNSRNM
jgi:hypothetical protein